MKWKGKKKILRTSGTYGGMYYCLANIHSAYTPLHGSIFPHSIDVDLDRVTCFSQWNVSRCRITEALNVLAGFDFVSCFHHCHLPQIVSAASAWSLREYSWDRQNGIVRRPSGAVANLRVEREKYIFCCCKPLRFWSCLFCSISAVISN